MSLSINSQLFNLENKNQLQPLRIFTRDLSSVCLSIYHRPVIGYSSMMSCFNRPQTKLGQGNIFRSVCQEFCLQGGILACIAGGIPACLAGIQGVSPGPQPGGIWPGGSPGPHPGGGCGCVSQHALRQTPRGWLLLLAVCILLECIFVWIGRQQRRYGVRLV